MKQSFFGRLESDFKPLAITVDDKLLFESCLNKKFAKNSMSLQEFQLIFHWYMNEWLWEHSWHQNLVIVPWYGCAIAGLLTIKPVNFMKWL